jgi:hypothetical protein
MSNARPLGSQVGTIGIGAFALALAACGDGNHVFNDAPGPCWPVPSTPGGSVTLGTGDVTWQPLGATMTITKDASQGDPFLAIHSRMHGFPPGDPQDSLNTKNPKTKLSAVVDGTNFMMGVPCPATLGYVNSPDGVSGDYDLVHGLRLGFMTSSNAQTQSGHTIHITLEVVGNNGLYAKDERTVMIDPFVGTVVDAGVDGPPTDAMPDAM